MTQLIELREHIREWYGKYNRYIIPSVKFILALIIFLMINHNIGYMGALNHIYVAVGLAVLCAMLPINMTLFLSAGLIVLHLYALSVDVSIMALLLLLIMFFLYFRFSPKNGYYVALTPLAFSCQIPYVMPVATGLVKEPYSIISVIFGTILYYFLEGVRNNAALLSDTSVSDEKTSEFVIAINQLFGNKEMYLVIVTFILAMLVVYAIRRQVIDHAWKIAISAGVLTQFVILCTGYLILGIKGKILWLVIGSILAVFISMLIEFLFFNLDYSRTEKVQFEDDEYYYYVKAVPKVNLSSGEKTVQKIAGKEIKEKRIKNSLRNKT